MNEFEKRVIDIQLNTRKRLLKKDPKFFDKYDIQEYPNGIDYIKTKKGEFVEWVRTPMEMKTLGFSGKPKKKKTKKKTRKKAKKKAKKKANKKANKKRKKKRNTMKKRKKKNK